MLWLALLACGDKEPENEDPPTIATPVVPEDFEGTVTVTTRDGVDLVADVYAGTGATGLVLLHMTPTGGWNRTDWPADFIERFTDAGHWVVALDRRGAGDSGGTADDAFEGPGGAYDVEAVMLGLQASGVDRVALIGASNGTTSAVDYAVLAATEGLLEPVALGFMTGGGYTENQHLVSAVTGLPAVFTYSTAEREWSVEQMDVGPDTWVFHEYPNGDHGTRMFDAEPSVQDDLQAFIMGVL